MQTLRLEAREQTEELWQFIADELDDATLDTISLEREHAPAEGIASEPVTTAIVLGLGSTVAIGIVRIVERWLEMKRQEGNLKLVLEGFQTSDKAGKALAKLEEIHSNVSVSFGSPDLKQQ